MDHLQWELMAGYHTALGLIIYSKTKDGSQEKHLEWEIFYSRNKVLPVLSLLNQALASYFDRKKKKAPVRKAITQAGRYQSLVKKIKTGFIRR